MKKVEVQTIVKNTLNKIKILDIHTHLFPPQHENYYLSGLVETLNYHYLIAELFVSTNINIEKFKSLDKLQKAEVVWNELFDKRKLYDTEAAAKAEPFIYKWENASIINEG